MIKIQIKIIHNKLLIIKFYHHKNKLYLDQHQDIERLKKSNQWK